MKDRLARLEQIQSMLNDSYEILGWLSKGDGEMPPKCLDVIGIPVPLR
jgi:hypothetical protein